MRRLLMIAALALTTAAPASAATLLLRYNFDEAASGATTALNQGGSVGSAGDGSFSTNATRTASTPGGASLGALDLTGNSAQTNYVGPSSDIDGLDTLSTLTITTWLNLRGPALGGSDGIISDRNHTTGPFGSGWAFFFYTSSPSDYTLSLAVGGANTAAAPAYTTASNNSWVFVAVTWDGGSGPGAVNFYRGTESGGTTLLGPATSSAGSLASPTAQNAVSLRVGQLSDYAPDATAPMYLDDIRVYSGVLTLSQLEQVRLENLPEPASLALLGAGVAMFMGRRRR